ncbi:MAG: hypothetical protein RBT49_00140 [Bacteroidales bacterium]|jgi:hypothetical protein|nr:hypothetical protein [Bacteroidales bacterium]
MFTKISLYIIGLFGFVLFSQENKQDELDTKPEIFIVGSIHSMHFNPDYNYSIIDLQSQISALKPDLVCGEIVPEAFDQPMEGYYPPEAAFLAEMATKLNYKFVPVDWRLDYATQSKAESEYPLYIKEQVKSLSDTMRSLINGSNSQSIYDFIHGNLNLQMTDSLYERIIGINSIAELASGNWHERNRRIVENALNAAKAKNAYRIVIVFGIDHIPQIKRQLNDLGFEPQIPKRLFVPDNNFEVSDEVLERWKRNLEYLKLIRDKKIPISDDNYQKVINSKRIQDLELAIQKSS